MNKESIPWGVEAIGAPNLWTQTGYGKGRVVAVIDSGCDVHHSALSSSIIASYNFTDFGDKHDVSDNVSHGTHVAGIIGARNFQNGLVGVAPYVKILVLKVFNSLKVESFRPVIDAINFASQWVGENGETVDIINLSLASKSENSELEKALKEAKEKNIFIVGASGNFNNAELGDLKLFPSYFPEVIQVGAVDRDKKIAPFSTKNNKAELLAPGVDILSTIPGNNEIALSGTSMAAPHITGLLALLLNIYSDKSIDRFIKSRLINEKSLFAHYENLIKIKD
ncbi:major intracellular serine protease [Salimicrobium jeotgali]|nr:S8 family peptidase [Salimicrobium jeotgali]MBM7697208.1 major intracellular serine protease [Salimicrobium jeotgali]